MKKYDIIVADPPWHYSASVKMHKQVSEHYKTMKLKDMMKIDISPLCKGSTLLFMWTTGPKMNEAMQLFEAWGFQYKTVAYVWKKGNHKNMGRYSMSQCEYVLVGKRRALGLLHHKCGTCHSFGLLNPQDIVVNLNKYRQR